MKFFDYLNLFYNRGLSQLLCEIKENYFFDKKFMLDTQSRLKLNSFQSYTPSYEYQFIKPINFIRKKEKLNQFCFYDIGSGKGKILFMACKLNFFKIIGIENNKTLYNISIKNKKKLGIKITKNIKIKNTSCFDYDYNLYKKNLIFYMFNPLDKNSTIKFVKFLRKYKKIKSKKIYLIFTGKNNMLKKINDETFFKKIKEFKSKQFNRDIAIYKL